MTEQKSIFDLADKFGYESPFGDWVSENKAQLEESARENLSVVKVEGPFDETGKTVNFISRNHEYYYLATLNQKISPNSIGKVKWAVSYDDDDAQKSLYLFSGGLIEQNKLKISLQSTACKKKFKVYAYVGNMPVNGIFVEVNFKQIIVLFIGGGGDAKKYLGQGPTYIVKDEIADPFEDIAPHKDYTSKYLGFDDIFKEKIKKNVLSLIENKEGSAVFIVGHSLGGWNGAHLSQILTDSQYNVEMLVTIDPVGTGGTVALISDIYWSTPIPKTKFWINIHTKTKENDIDDYVAWGGGQWIPNKKDVDIFYETKYHHREAGNMFKEIIKDGNSSSDFLLNSINTYLQKK